MLKTLVVLSFLLTACFALPQAPTNNPEYGRQEMQMLSRRSVKIEWICGLDNKGGMGSGVVLGPKGGKTLVATAAHVTDYIIEEGCNIIVYDWKGFSGYGEVLKVNKDTDVAIIEVGERIGEAARLFNNPYLGQSIACVGWPLLPYTDYRGKSITRGHVSTLGVDGFIRISADIYFGNSGGACFSRDGKVVGIVSYFMAGSTDFLGGGAVQHPGQYFISHVDNLKKLLD